MNIDILGTLISLIIIAIVIVFVVVLVWNSFINLSDFVGKHVINASKHVINAYRVLTKPKNKFKLAYKKVTRMTIDHNTRVNKELKQARVLRAKAELANIEGNKELTNKYLCGSMQSVAVAKKMREVGYRLSKRYS